MAASQKYEIIGAHNVRDLGGYKTRDGKVYKIGEFICGDSLHRIHKSGIKSLIEKNLTTVIDLRTKKVLEEKPNLFWLNVQDVNFLNFPLLEDLSPKSLGTFTTSARARVGVIGFGSCKDLHAKYVSKKIKYCQPRR